MADLATAYLRLVPSLKGAKSTIESELGGVNVGAAGDKLGGGLGEGIKGGLGKLALGTFLGGMLLQGVTAAAHAAADVFSESFSASADFEQLAGGVETLFGESAEKAMQNAQNAFKTAGISANEYMNQVNSFAASLRQSLGPERAGELADYADKAVQDMADNANKMGTEMASIQNAYQGFAKQNYTMLDNLKLGYGGTKSEMERLLADASKLAGTEFNIESYSDVIDAIHVMQENMGITGTTAEEAAHTVSGSIGMMQSAWANLLAEFGKEDGDVEARVQDLVESIGAVLENVPPMAERILSGMGQAIGDFASRAADYFMEHQTEIFDKIGELVQGAASALMQALPYIIAGVGYLIGSALVYIVSHLPEIAQTAVMIIGEFFSSMLSMKADGENTVGEIIGAMLVGIGNFFGDMFNAGANLVQGFIDGILSMPGRVIDAIGGVVGGAIDQGKAMLGIASPSKVFRQIGEYTMMGLEEGIVGELPGVSRAMDRVNGVLTAQGDVSVSAGRKLASGMEVLGGNVGGLGSEPRQLTVILELDRTQFGKMVYALNGEETQRVGVNLAGGFA